ncbi:thiamine-phosphate kinase, partial [Pseudomonas sp. Pseusp97]|uniref:thiamine-phosphate kinase n=1 Tax=Pseudomonas sp. Pseusp97 TaxID=3243065 RepID=UPI0039A5D4FF
YWSPQPQLDFGVALRGKATAALDISDGLLADCGHIARASGVALVVEADKLPASPALEALLGPERALQLKLGAGDDYVLAFTLPPEHLPALSANWPALCVVGRVEAGSGVRVLDGSGADITPRQGGYLHFME